MTRLVLILAVAVSLIGATAAPEGANDWVATTSGQSGSSGIGTALVGGKASHVPASWGASYLALPEHRWGRRGLLVTVCGVDCITRRSTDAGPDLAMQRAGRVVDLSWHDFRIVCGVAEGEPDPGLCDVTVEYLGEIELPATDAIEEGT